MVKRWKRHRRINVATENTSCSLAERHRLRLPDGLNSTGNQAAHAVDTDGLDQITVATSGNELIHPLIRL